MPTFNGRNFTGLSGINMRSTNGAIRFETPDIIPTTTSGERLLYVDASGNLCYDNGSSIQVVGTAGGGAGAPSWESIFAGDSIFTITPDTTWTVAGNRSTATNVMTISNIGGGSGALLAFSNSGTGNDILGTSSTWSVTKAGVATFAGISISGTTTAIASTGAAVWTLKDNDSAALSIGSTGATSMLKFVTTDGSESVVFGNSMQVTDGNATFISTSNTVANVLVTNNTITTFGANASSSGVFVIRSTSLTTGSLLQLQLSDTANVGGFYLNCRESIGGTNDFTIGENGVVVMAGTAGSDSFTMNAGDVVLSDSSITMIDADNAATLSVTNNTATSASVFVFAGSGVFTGSTTTSWMTLTQSGLTSGTAVYLVTAGLTSGRALDVVANAATTSTGVVSISSTGLTSGSVLLVTAGGANMTSGGKGVEIAMGAATVGAGLTIVTSGVYTGAGTLQITANSATTGTIAVITANGLTTGHGLTITSSGTIATTGDLLNIVGNTATTSTGLVRVSATGMTSGSTVLVTGGGANITSAGKVLEVAMGAATAGVGVSIVSTGVYITGSSGLLNVTANSATSTTGLVQVSGTGLTGGSIALLTGGGANMTVGGKVVEVAMGAATTGVGLSITTSGVYSNTTTGLISVVADSATTGQAIKVSMAGVTTGVGLLLSAGAGVYTGSGFFQITGSAATTGVIALISNSGVMTGAGQLLQLTAAGATTASAVMGITTAALTTGVALVVTADALTTGRCATFTSNSADTGTRQIVNIVQDHASASGSTPLRMQQDAATSTNYYRMTQWVTASGTVTLWMGNGTTANGTLSGTAGDILINGGSNKPEYCTGTTNWTALV